MRRVALLSLIPVLAMGAAGCRHDGRSLRPARPDQTQSISTTAVSTTIADGEGGDIFDTVPDSSPDTSPDGSGATDTASVPIAQNELSITAPWDGGGKIDPRYTCDGDNIAPAVSWSPAPDGTVEIAITLRDDDLPTFGHWALAGIAPDQVALAEDSVPIGAYEATNGAGQIGYSGPCPPAGSTHHYVLTVHYLGARTNLSDGVAAGELIDGITAAEIASVSVEGSFNRA